MFLVMELHPYHFSLADLKNLIHSNLAKWVFYRSAQNSRELKQEESGRFFIQNSAVSSILSSAGPCLCSCETYSGNSIRVEIYLQGLWM